MAAHDDKISTNRRRLFKALSVAPVVYTLDSGAQQAISSVYQCAEKIAEPSEDPNLTQFGPNVVTEQFMQVGQQTYWPQADFATSGNFFVTDGIYIYRGDVNGGLVEKKLPYTGTAGPAAGDLKIANNQNQSHTFNGKYVFLWNTSDGGDWDQISDEKKDDGILPVLGEVDHSVPNFSYDIEKPYPITPNTGNLQGMTGTCLCSINPNDPNCSLLR